jgi:hypothetical protein
VGQILVIRIKEPMGLMEQMEDGEEYHKILALLPGEESPFDERVRGKLIEFVSHVFDHMPGKQIIAGQFHGREAALNYL